MRIQLWSYNYDPEPQGCAPLSRMQAVELSPRGHRAGFTYAKENFHPSAIAVRAERVLMDVTAQRDGRGGTSTSQPPPAFHAAPDEQTANRRTAPQPAGRQTE
jgi:hypothetical protein